MINHLVIGVDEKLFQTMGAGQPLLQEFRDLIDHGLPRMNRNIRNYTLDVIVAMISYYVSSLIIGLSPSRIVTTQQIVFIASIAVIFIPFLTLVLSRVQLPISLVSFDSQLAPRVGAVLVALPLLILLNDFLGDSALSHPMLSGRILSWRSIFVSHLIMLIAFCLGYSAYLRERILVFGSATLLMLIILELVFRSVLPQPKFDPRLPYLPHRDRVVHLSVEGLSPVAHMTTNSWGFRGDEPPDNWEEYYTIVTIGGSTTLDLWKDNSKTWPALLQEHLQNQNSDRSIWVGNAGLDGHTSRGHVLVMDEVVREIRPDAVIFLVGINDLGTSFREGVSAFDEARNPLLFESQLFRLLWTYKRVHIDRDVVIDDTGPPPYSPQPVDQELLTEVPDDLSELLPSLPEYRQNLERLIDIAEELDIDVLFLTQPSRYDDTEYWQGILGTNYWIQDSQITVSAATHWRMLDLFNQELLDVCRDRHVPCFDLAGSIPSGGTYFYDSSHFNDAGSALVAELVADAVQEQLLDK